MAGRYLILGIAVSLLAQKTANFSSDVNLVRVPVVVTDREGRPVTGLTAKDFILTENGKPRAFKYLWQEADLPLTVGLLVDISGSQRKFIEQHQQTILKFLSRVVSAKDRAFLASIERDQRLVTDLTNSVEALSRGVDRVERKDTALLGDPCLGRRVKFSYLAPSVHVPCGGGSSIWNGIYYSAKLKLMPESGRKAILLLSDGYDTGAEHDITDAIAACQRAETVVYTIRYREPLEDISKFRGSFGHRMRRVHQNMEQDVERLSAETGGLVFDGASANLTGVFDSIETALRSQYVLGFTEPNQKREGFHRIKVKIDRPDLTVRTRAGYYAK